MSTADTVSYVGARLFFVTRRIALRRGDVPLTGGPAGVRPPVAGDRMEVRTEGVGTPANLVAGAAPPGTGRPDGSGDV
ncbi:hypothetical protein ACFC09_43840 [Streptomyces sp. NPDC056161]|uniref:hypothetical protein n=1 Tax=Streptomyces sp. NPDC056161 TaxID=3345732 RepID=UPI0035E1BEEB